MHSLCNEKRCQLIIELLSNLCGLVLVGGEKVVLLGQHNKTFFLKTSCSASPPGSLTSFYSCWIIQTLFTLGLHTLAWTCLLYPLLYFFKEMINRTKRGAHYLVPLLLDNKPVLPLFKIRYPEINSENSWNFTKYPEILQNVPVFYSIVYDATNSWNFFILEMCFFYPGKSPNSWKFLNFGRKGSTAINSQQKDDFFKIKELVRDSKWTAFSTWKYHK